MEGAVGVPRADGTATHRSNKSISGGCEPRQEVSAIQRVIRARKRASRFRAPGRLRLADHDSAEQLPSSGTPSRSRGATNPRRPSICGERGAKTWLAGQNDWIGPRGWISLERRWGDLVQRICQAPFSRCSWSIGVVVRSEAEPPRAVRAVEGAGLRAGLLDEKAGVPAGHVSVGTMHLAKSPEFGSVVVMACDDDVIPLQERTRGHRRRGRPPGGLRDRAPPALRGLHEGARSPAGGGGGAGVGVSGGSGKRSAATRTGAAAWLAVKGDAAYPFSR